MDPMGLSVRPAAAADVEPITEFNLRMAEETESRRLERATVRRGVGRVLEDGARGRYFVVERGGGVVGQLLVTQEWSDWRDGWFWWIQSVYVVPELRGQGVYRLLHEHVCAAARAQGDVCGVRLYVDAENERAQRVYERMGMLRTRYLIYETDWSDAPRR